MVPFGGGLMPVQYTGIVDEHQTVRNAVGMFDISHMGQFIVSGNDARDWLNRMLTNNVANLAVGQGHYTFLLNDNGGVIQGPRVVDLFHDLLGQSVELPPRNHIIDLVILEMPVSIARTGYTGEDGVEVFFRASDAAKFWTFVLERGARFGAKPC